MTVRRQWVLLARSQRHVRTVTISEWQPCKFIISSTTSQSLPPNSCSSETKKKKRTPWEDSELKATTKTSETLAFWRIRYFSESFFFFFTIIFIWVFWFDWKWRDQERLALLGLKKTVSELRSIVSSPKSAKIQARKCRQTLPRISLPLRRSDRLMRISPDSTPVRCQVSYRRSDRLKGKVVQNLKFEAKEGKLSEK